ncbi:MAG: sugar transferase [Chloroflexi bacterium]|nr:MAG: sugar transferase [Phototrophicales bacterium]RMF79685.1 MAG: sugar transferase [Chloroflexota bacterium]
MFYEANFGYQLFLQVSDMLIVVLSLAAASYLRINIGLGRPGVDEAFGTPTPLFFVAAGVWWTALQIAHEYSSLNAASLWRMLQRFLFGHLLAMLLFFGTLYLTYRDYSRLQSFYFLLIVFVTTGLYRIATYRLWKIFLRNDKRHFGVAIVGLNAHAQNLGEKLLSRSEQGVHLHGYIRYEEDVAPENLNAPVIGTVQKMTDILAEYKINEIIITIDGQRRIDFHQLLRILQQYTPAIRLAPDYSEYAYFRVSVDDFEGFPLLGLRQPILSPSQRLIKRIFDIVVSLLVMTLGSPIFVLVAIAVRLDSSGPIIIWQERIGQYGKPFKMLKFRSMIAGAERENKGAKIKQRDDERITRIGRFIRRTSLDELPQFVNILRGEMSLVGPRPELPERVVDYQDWQRKRFEVPQGLTGWWQINGRADLPMIENTEYDLYYISHYSLWLDLQILFRTIFVVMRGTGAY